MAASIIVIAQIAVVLQPYFVQHTYAMGSAETLLQSKNPFLASKLEHDTKTASFVFNKGYSPDININQTGGPVISAAANEDPAKGLQVTDPISNASLVIKPQFALLHGRQDGNRVVYPLQDGTGWLVYTMQAAGVKEDIVLSHANGDVMKLKYTMDLDNEGLAAHLQPDGSIGIYGPSIPITGSISTGNAKDAALLQKARNNAKKDKYLFSLPTPTVYQSDHRLSSAKTHYELKGAVVTTVTTGLKKASFPLTVDPAVTVTSSGDLFRDTNAESDIDFNGSTGNINRGQVTGGVVVTNWTANGNNLATARWSNGAAIYDDYSYVAGGAGAGSTSNISTVEYAANSKANQSIGAWATTTQLPAALSHFQLLIYNGYMYAIGGSLTNTTCASVSNTIYYNRIQTNGQLSANWNTNSVTLPTGVCGLGAAIYNGKLYVAGGRTSSTTASGITTVSYASVNPDGSIGSFTNDDSTLPAARYDFDLKAYNGHLYAVAGTLAGATTGTVLIAPLASDGSLYGGAGSATWVSGTSLVTARTAMGGTLAAVNDGFMYVEGGCNTLNVSQTCNSASGNTQGDIEIAQINADGTLGNWSNLATTVANYVQVGGNLIFWRGTIYVFAGCSSISTSAIQCTTALNAQEYDTIATPGQISPVKTSSTNTPSLTTAVWGHGMAIVNGYVFVIGGCVATSCQTSVAASLTATVQVAKLNANGSTGSWGTTTSIPVALSATAIAVYNNYIYVMGGYDYTATSNGSAVNTIYYGQVSATGTIASWSTAANTYVTAANARYYSSATAYRGILYVFGGCVAPANQTGCSTYYNNVFKSTIGAAGAPGSWTATTASLPNTSSAAEALMSAAVYNGYVYLCGGGGQNSGGQASTIQYAKIQSGGDITSFSNTTGIMTTDGTTALPLRRTDAYAMNGYLYVVGGHNGNTGLTYGTIQIGKITLSSGNITSNLSPSITQMTQRWDTRAAFSNGYIYVMGGCDGGSPANNCSNPSTKSEYFEIYNAGNKGTGTWASPTAYTTNRVGAASVAYNGYLYVAGGCQAYTVGASLGNTTTQCTTPGTNNLNTVAYTAINPDGTLGTWTTSGNNLTASNARAFGCLMAAGGYLYYVGGEDNTGAATATVLYSQIGANGVPGTWAQATQGLTAARRNLSCGIFNSHVYATGGINGSNADVTTVDYSPDLSSGGNITSVWTAFGTGFTTARANHVALVAAGYLYVIGGDNATSAQIDVQFIQLNPSGGSTGSWANSGDLPQGVTYQSGIAANGYIYLFGGRTAAAACLGDGSTAGFTYVASVNSTGITSNWSQGANTFTTPRFGTTAAFYNGYYYMMGGDDCTNVISTSVIQSDGEQSQSMRATFSKYADLNGNGDPEKLVIYLTNAQNNSVDIEKWQLVYQSSFDSGSTPSWGVTTTISPLVTQNAYAVSAYDGSGVDQQLSRWFYLAFSINMEQSFSFTDDTQPTVYQYGLHYAPPPAKRLMHGRDFRDQTQQGEDLKL